MATVNTTYGADIAIGAALTPSTVPSGTESEILADFDAFTYISIEEVTDLGSVGDTSTTVTHLPVKAGRTRKFKGSRDAGEQTITCAYSPDDPGQDAMRAASKTQFDYPFKLTLNDAPTGGTPTEIYYYGKVMANPFNFGGSDTITEMTYTIGINSAVYIVEAATA